MNLILKQYIKSFLVYGVISGVTLFFWIYSDFGEIDLKEKVFVVFVIWFTLSISSVSFHIHTVRRVKNSKLSEEDFKTHRKTLLNKRLPVEDVLLVLNSEESTKKWIFICDKNTIYGKSQSIVGRFLGGNLKINFMNDQIIIESSPNLKTAIFDNGKNLKNVMLIKRVIKNI